MVSRGCPREVGASGVSESRIEVSRTSSKRKCSAGDKLGGVRRVGSLERLGNPKGAGVVENDA
jgi:hypothetical protein